MIYFYLLCFTFLLCDFTGQQPAQRRFQYTPDSLYKFKGSGSSSQGYQYAQPPPKGENIYKLDMTLDVTLIVFCSQQIQAQHPHHQ